MEQGLILMEDGAPVHRCNIANQWRKERGIDVLCWPSQSPDLNPIENLWMIMKRKVQQHRSRVGKFKNVEEHKACLQKVWDEMNPEDWNKLIASMPKRIKMVIKSKGGSSGY